MGGPGYRVADDIWEQDDVMACGIQWILVHIYGSLTLSSKKINLIEIMEVSSLNCIEKYLNPGDQESPI